MAKANEVKFYAINRAFDHKAYGRIGIVEMSAQVEGIAINGKELPASSIEYLLTFALQNLQDAYAGADSADEAVARFEKKLDKLIEGTIGLRSGGDGASAEVKVRRTVLGELIRKTEAGKDAWKANEANRAEWLDAVFAKQAEDKQAEVMAEVAKRIAEAQAKAKQAAALANGIEF